VPLITSANYPAIRAAIDTSLDVVALPDATIALDIYAGAAMRDVLARDPLALSRTGDDLARVTAAAVYFAASRLILALPQIRRENYPEQEYVRQEVDIWAHAAELRSLAEAEISLVLDLGDATADRPTMFVAGHGRRGASR